MAKSGFVPAWMKIQSSDKTNGSPKLAFDRSASNNRHSQASNRSETSSTSSSPPRSTGRQRHHSSDVFEPTTRQSSWCYYRTFGQSRSKANDQPLPNEHDGHAENFFAFPSAETPSRRSYSRERAPNSFAKHPESNGTDFHNGYRSLNTSQRRLHSVSSYSNDRPPSHARHSSTNGTFSDRTSNEDREKPPSDQRTSTTGFDRLEQDFPSLNGHDKNHSSSNDRSSSVWNNAASKLRTSYNEPFKLLDRSLTNTPRLYATHRVSARRDRLPTAPNNGLNGMPSSPTTRSIALELPTNCITQPKNLNKRSDFFNSLKHDSTNDENKNEVKRSYDPPAKPAMFTGADRHSHASKGVLLLLSVPETPEEKELLVRMGWQESDEIHYEITDEDKEEYEKQLKLLRKSNNTSAALMSALHRRALPCVDIRDLLRFEMLDSLSDDDDDDDDDH